MTIVGLVGVIIHSIQYSLGPNSARLQRSFVEYGLGVTN